MSPVPVMKLNNGLAMPTVGLGTWKSKPGEVGAAVTAALACGYPHLDCAHVYQNEAEIGKALAGAWAAGHQREDVFITSKLWNTHHRPDQVRGALERTLADLQLSYLDLYLIHWPQGFLPGEDLFPKEADGGFAFDLTPTLDTWRELEKCVEAGLVRSIGLSNFNSEQIDALMPEAKIKPAVLQVEINPYFSNKQLIEHCAKHDIVVTSYSPFGSPDRPWVQATDPAVLEDPVLVALAEKYRKTPAQVVLRWLLQCNLIVIPKSVTPSRIKENFQILDFKLSEDDVKAVDALNRNFRICPVEGCAKHPLYPFHIPY